MVSDFDKFPCAKYGDSRAGGTCRGNCHRSFLSAASAAIPAARTVTQFPALASRNRTRSRSSMCYKQESRCFHTDLLLQDKHFLSFVNFLLDIYPNFDQFLLGKKCHHSAAFCKISCKCTQINGKKTKFVFPCQR